MTTTNRFANRLFLIVLGVISLAVGLFVAATALPGAPLLRDWLTTARDAQSTALSNTRAGGNEPFDGSYLPWLLAVLCLLIVIIALVAIVTRGRGRTDRVVDLDENAGRVIVSSSFAETALVDALSSRRDVASVSVVAYELKGAPALKIRLRLTAGSAPTDAVQAASGAVRGLDRVLGGEAEIPVLVEVVGASPVRPGADSRVR